MAHAFDFSVVRLHIALNVWTILNRDDARICLDRRDRHVLVPYGQSIVGPAQAAVINCCSQVRRTDDCRERTNYLCRTGELPLYRES